MVRPGDTLYSISRTHKVNLEQLIAANRIVPPFGIKAGQTLQLPASRGGLGAGRPDVAGRSQTLRASDLTLAQ